MGRCAGRRGLGQDRSGLDELIEKILLQAELLELRANPDRAAEATVIEAKLDKGNGPLATVLVNRGTLKRGDVFVVGTAERPGPRDDRRQGPADQGSRPVDAGRSARPRRRAATPATTSPWSRTNSAPAKWPQYRQEKATDQRTATAPASLDTMFSA